MKEKLDNIEPLGVYEESAPLKKVLMWGAPGTETVLGQLLPKEISRFETQFDVLEARKEFEAAKNLLESQGVEAVLVKDLFAKMLSEKGIRSSLSLGDLKEELEDAGRSFYEKWKGYVISDLDVLGWLDTILEEDANKYGEEVAVAMNRVLSIGQDLPLANVLYARDQSNLLGKTWVWSSMRHDIRRPEVELYKTILEYNGFLESGEVGQVQVNGEGRFEGGDGIAHGGSFYIGVGGRTNLSGVLQVSRSILQNGGRILVPIDEERDKTLKDEMDAMHLDTIWMPSDLNEIVVCGVEVERRKLLEITMSSNGSLTVENKGSFADHLARLEVDIVPLTKEEQEGYAPNFLNLGNKKVILSLADGNNLTEELEKRGKKVYNADLKNITKGYGGLHCMTAAIKRD